MCLTKGPSLWETHMECRACVPGCRWKRRMRPRDLPWFPAPLSPHRMHAKDVRHATVVSAYSDCAPEAGALESLFGARWRSTLGPEYSWRRFRSQTNLPGRPPRSSRAPPGSLCGRNVNAELVPIPEHRFTLEDTAHTQMGSLQLTRSSGQQRRTAPLPTAGTD
jgi:hypothetical protein